MSMILSSFSTAAYQAADRNTLAQSAEAVAGTKQAFAETDEESRQGRRHCQDSGGTFPALPDEDATTTSMTDNHRHVLNVTA